MFRIPVKFEMSVSSAFKVLVSHPSEIGGGHSPAKREYVIEMIEPERSTMTMTIATHSMKLPFKIKSSGAVRAIGLCQLYMLLHQW